MAGIPTIETYPMPAEIDLPGNVAKWQVDPCRAMLLIHDMQNYFVRRFPDQPRELLVDNIGRLRRRCDELNIPVGYTAQPGGMTDEQRGLLRDFWGPGMRVDPADRAIIDPLAPQPGDWHFPKWRYSAFHRSTLRDQMRAAGRDQLDHLRRLRPRRHPGDRRGRASATTSRPSWSPTRSPTSPPGTTGCTLEYAAARCAVVVTTATLIEQLWPPAPPDAGGRAAWRSSHERNDTQEASDLLESILTDPPRAFALLHRPESGGAGVIEVVDRRGDHAVAAR